VGRQAEGIDLYIPVHANILPMAGRPAIDSVRWSASGTDRLL
jgi:hypothetical protein